MRLGVVCSLLLASLLGFVLPANSATVTVSNLWSIATTNGRVYVNPTNDVERGVAYNALTEHAYIVSRNLSNQIAIVDGATGNHVGYLSVVGVSGGAFALNQIGVADDGTIYAANLTTGSGTSPFKIYKWTSEAAAPVVVYSGNPSSGASIRFGDAIDVRGSGTNTEVIASTGGTAATNSVAVFRANDAAVTGFTSKYIAVPAAGLADFAKGIGFGPGNTFIGKNSGNASLRYCSYDFAAGTGAILATYTVASALAAVNIDPVNNIIAGVATANAASPHYLAVYDISTGSASLIYSNNAPGPLVASANVVGGIDVSGYRIIAVDAKNGVQMAQMFVDTNVVPPTVSAAGDATIVENGYGSITAGVTGSAPFSYQWLFNNAVIPNATNITLTLTNLTLAGDGLYRLIVTNTAGAATSAPTHVTVMPAVSSLVLTQLWRIAPGSVPYVANDNNQRGIAYNAYRNHLLLVSRTPSNAVHVLDANTGAYLHSLLVTGVVGGTFAMNMIGCTPDGQVVVGNLTTDGTTSPFKLWSWVDDDADVAPQLIWAGDPGAGTYARWGDNMAVSGTIGNVQVLLGSRTNKFVSLVDQTFGATIINTPAAAYGSFGLGVAFAGANSFWGKATGSDLLRVNYDVNNVGTIAQTITNYPNMAAIAYDPVNQWLAGITVETPDTVRILDVEGRYAAYIELDTEIFQTDNANSNGTGALCFGPNRLFALDSNNGIVAYKIAPKIRRTISGNTMTFQWDGSHTLQAAPAVNGPWTNAYTGASPFSINVTDSPQLFYRAQE